MKKDQLNFLSQYQKTQREKNSKWHYKHISGNYQKHTNLNKNKLNSKQNMLKNNESTRFSKTYQDQIKFNNNIESILNSQISKEQLQSKNTQSISSLKALTSIKLYSNSETNNLKMTQTNFEKQTKTLEKHKALKKQKIFELKEIIQKQNIKSLITCFVQKIRRNNIYTQKKVLQINDQIITERILYSKGVQVSQNISKIFQFVFLFIQISQICIYPLNLSFQLSAHNWMIIYQEITLVFCLIDFFYNLITVRIQGGKQITFLKDIIQHYFFDQMIVDLCLIAIILISYFTQDSFIDYFKLAIIIKIPQCLKRLEKIQIYFIQSNYKQQYWSIVKVFLFNFFYAHFLAIILNIVSKIQPQQSWLTNKDLIDAPWYQIYIWGYYWSVNIMLTVGFGDISAKNYIEAICLIFLQTFSCIVLAYNINCVGNLISNIRKQDYQKFKKHKIFRSLAFKNHISNDLVLKVTNFIEESNNEQKDFVDSLPKLYKKKYFNQSNRCVFQNILFFRNLTQKSIQYLAQNIQARIYHPYQQILERENYLDLKILKQGKIGFTIKKPGCLYNGKVIDTFQVKSNETPFLIGINIFTLKKPNYEVKSLQYSINFTMSIQKLIDCLKQCQGDYQYFCYLKDKNKHIPDQFQIFPCNECKTKHTKFDCPKYHYVPYHQYIKQKYLYLQKTGINYRDGFFQRERSQKQNSLTICKYYNSKSLLNKNIKELKVSWYKQQAKNNIKQSRESIRLNRLSLVLFNQPNNAQKIRQQLTNFLKKQQEEDDVWQLSLDLMQNYKSYFIFNNSSNLQNLFQKKASSIKKFEKIKQIDSILSDSKVDENYFDSYTNRAIIFQDNLIQQKKGKIHFQKSKYDY